MIVGLGRAREDAIIGWMGLGSTSFFLPNPGGYVWVQLGLYQ